MKPPIEFRPHRAFKVGETITTEIPGFETVKITATAESAAETLARKRRLKAAQMRRYRAKRAGKTT